MTRQANMEERAKLVTIGNTSFSKKWQWCAITVFFCLLDTRMTCQAKCQNTALVTRKDPLERKATLVTSEYSSWETCNDSCHSVESSSAVRNEATNQVNRIKQPIQVRKKRISFRLIGRSTQQKFFDCVFSIKRCGGKGDSSGTNKKSSVSDTKESKNWKQILTLTLVTVALFNDMLQVTMLLPMIPSLLASPPPFGVSPNKADVAMGVFFASKDICQLAMAPLAGMLTAKTSSQTALLASTVALGLATFVFADAASFRDLLLARGCQGAASAATLCGGLSLIAETFPTTTRGSAMGIAYTGLALGLLCGPLIGGVMYDKLGRSSTFRFAALVVLGNALAQLISFFLSTVNKSIFPTNKKERSFMDTKADNPSNSTRTSSWSAFSRLLTNGDVLAVTLSTAAIHAAVGAIKPLSQVVLEKEYEMAIVNRSLVITIATLTFFLTAPIAGRLSDIMKKSNLIATSLGLATLSTVCFGLRTQVGEHGLTIFSISVALLGCALGMNGSVGQALMADLVDRYNLGEYSIAYALADVSDSLGLIAGSIIGLSLSQKFGPSIGVGVLGIFCLVLLPRILQIK